MQCYTWNHKLISRRRVAVVFAIQSWLAESAEQRKTSTTPAYFQVGMSCKSYDLVPEIPHSTNAVIVMSLVVVSCLCNSLSSLVACLILCHRATLPCSSRHHLFAASQVRVQRLLQLRLLPKPAHPVSMRLFDGDLAVSSICIIQGCVFALVIFQACNQNTFCQSTSSNPVRAILPNDLICRQVLVA